MSASSRMKIIIPVVSAMSLLALSAQAQDAGPPRDAAQPPGQGTGSPPPANQTMRKGPPPQAGRPAPQPSGQAHVAPGPGQHDRPHLRVRFGIQEALEVAGLQLVVPGIQPHLFERWLALFDETCRELFEDSVSDEFRSKAVRIAESLKLALFYRPDRPWPPESTR